MGKIDFVKIHGKDVAFIDEISPEFEGIPLPCPFELSPEISIGDVVMLNENEEVVLSNGFDTAGIVEGVRGIFALVQTHY